MRRTCLHFICPRIESINDVVADNGKKKPNKQIEKLIFNILFVLLVNDI